MSPGRRAAVAPPPAYAARRPYALAAVDRTTAGDSGHRFGSRGAAEPPSASPSRRRAGRTLASRVSQNERPVSRPSTLLALARMCLRTGRRRDYSAKGRAERAFRGQTLTGAPITTTSLALARTQMCRWKCGPADGAREHNDPALASPSGAPTAAGVQRLRREEHFLGLSQVQQQPRLSARACENESPLCHPVSLGCGRSGMH